MFRMRKIILRHVAQIKERFEKKIHYHWFSVNPKIAGLSYTQAREKKDKIF